MPQEPTRQCRIRTQYLIPKLCLPAAAMSDENGTQHDIWSSITERLGQKLRSRRAGSLGHASSSVRSFISAGKEARLSRTVRRIPSRRTGSGGLCARVHQRRRAPRAALRRRLSAAGAVTSRASLLEPAIAQPEDEGLGIGQQVLLIVPLLQLAIDRRSSPPARQNFSRAHRASR